MSIGEVTLYSIQKERVQGSLKRVKGLQSKIDNDNNNNNNNNNNIKVSKCHETVQHHLREGGCG